MSDGRWLIPIGGHLQCVGPAMSETATRASGKWAQPGVPHKGWTRVDIEDLGEPSEVCAMREIQEIRYVHHMQPPA